MRIGVFGGTFDPPHLGHLILAESCREAARLEEVWFVPSYHPPHKSTAALTRFDNRLDMTQLAITGHSVFRAEACERELSTPSYTAHTLEALQTQHPEAQFAFLIGADSLPEMAGWYEPARILARAELVVVARPGDEVWPTERLAHSLGVPPEQVRLTVAPSPLIEISSRDLRARLQAGRSVRFQIPRAVEEYIRDKALYRTAS